MEIFLTLVGLLDFVNLAGSGDFVAIDTIMELSRESYTRTAQSWLSEMTED